jgi:alpha-galactosidase
MRINIPHIENDFLIKEFDHEFWRKGQEVLIESYWSGKKAASGRHAKAKLLWSDSAFYVRFEANQTEPLVVSKAPNLKSKTKGLWDRDVCEIFVAPNSKEPNKYFEFEIAPNGEWIDLEIHRMSDERKTDLDYQSGMESAAKIEIGKVLMAMKIKWKAFGKTPKVKDIWKGNLFRCVGSGETRGYLAWSPTKTEMPNFHIPEAFGEFEFL